MGCFLGPSSHPNGASLKLIREIGKLKTELEVANGIIRVFEATATLSDRDWVERERKWALQKQKQELELQERRAAQKLFITELVDEMRRNKGATIHVGKADPPPAVVTTKPTMIAAKKK